MKKTSRLSALIISGGLKFFMWGLLFQVVPTAWASVEIDRRYAFETIGILKSWDNVDNVFADYVAAAFNKYFSNHYHMIVNDLSRANEVVSRSKLTYQQIIQDPDILAQIARSSRSESIIRTVITQKGTEYLFQLDWLHAPQMELMGSVHFTVDPLQRESTAGSIEESSNEATFENDLISAVLNQNLDRLFSQLPFKAQVSGRDHQAVTLNFLAKNQIKKGDVLAIATIQQVKKHPLLKTIVDWKFIPTGKVKVNQVDEGMAFCQIIEEDPEHPIGRYQKVTHLEENLASMDSQSKDASTEAIDKVSPPAEKPPEETPHFGWVALSVPLGSYSQVTNSPANSVTNSGGGLSLGGRADGQIWFNQSWFGDFGFGYNFWNFSQTNNQGSLTTISQNGGVTGSDLSLKFDVGYSYLIDGTFFGPKGWIKLGYLSNGYNFPASTTEFTGPVSYNSAFVGIGGDFPFLVHWGVQANLNYRIVTGVSQSWINETQIGGSDTEIYLGGYYRYTSRISFVFGLTILSSDATFSSNTTLAQKTITFSPQLLYYF